jgi:putative nucleotidyltransferase with HDIG domain
MAESDHEGGRRWQGRPLLSAVVLVAAHGIPIAAAVATSAALSRRFHEPDGLSGAVAQWGLLFVASAAVLLLVDRAAKRLLPLAALLKLSMLFPDAAPKRMKVARKSGSIRKLQTRLDEAKALGAEDEPTRAAEVILALVGALHAHDRHTRGHSERVRWFTDLLAEELKLAPADRDRLRWASLLHDIGKLHVSPKILNKPGQLVRREWRHIHRHPEAGARIVAPLAGWLGEWAATVEQHHENYDGTGYPHRLKGDEICLGARIVAVADAYEVMTAARSYKKAASAASARKELTRSAGSHFDPAVVRAFLNISIGRLRWVTGPVAWVAQIPFVGWLPRLAESTSVVAGQTAGAVGAVALMTGGSSLVVSPDEVVADEVPVLDIETDVANPVSLIGDLTPTTVRTRMLSDGARRETVPQPAPAAPETSPVPTPGSSGEAHAEAPGQVAESTLPAPAVENRSDQAEVVPGAEQRATPAVGGPAVPPVLDESTRPLKSKAKGGT